MKLFRKAILIIHGFAGGTYDTENLAHYLELNSNYDVFQFTLPGHEKKVSKVKYEDWIKSSEKNIEWLIEKGYKNIYVIGHSMGGVIATYIASKYKEVKKLVLAAPAFQYLSVIDNKINLPISIAETSNLFKSYNSDEILSRILKLNPSYIKEFINLIKKYYMIPTLIKCPVLLIHGNKDTLVPITSSKYVYDNIKSSLKELIYFDGVTHDIFRGERNLEIIEYIDEFLKNQRNGGIYNI